jgi:hypothetical protein
MRHSTMQLHHANALHATIAPCNPRQAVKSLAALDSEAALAGMILPGSDLHTLTTARLVDALREKHGQKDPRTQAAIAQALEVRRRRCLHGAACVAVARCRPACMGSCPRSSTQRMPPPHGSPPKLHINNHKRQPGP